MITSKCRIINFDLSICYTNVKHQSTKQYFTLTSTNRLKNVISISEQMLHPNLYVSLTFIVEEVADRITKHPERIKQNTADLFGLQSADGNKDREKLN